MENLEREQYYSQLPIPEPEAPPAIGPSNPPWGSVEAVGIWLASVFFILFVPALFLLPYLATRTPPIIDNAQMVEFAKSDPTSIVLQIIGIVPAHLLTLLVAWASVTRMRKFSFRQTLGWETGDIRWWHYLIILGVFFAIAAVVNIFVPEQENDLIKMLQSSKYAVYLIAIIAVATAPLIEEVIYRGVLYSAFQRTLGVPAAFLLVTCMFALVHVPQYWPSFSTIGLLGLLSVVLTAIRVKTRNLLPCIILHTIFNGIQSILLVVSENVGQTDTPEPVNALLRLTGLH